MTTRRLAWAIWGLTVVLDVAWPFLSEAAKVPDNDPVAFVLFGLAIAGYATVGVLVTSRHPGNRIGLLLAGIGLAAALSLVGGSYAKLAFDGGRALPFPQAAAWFGQMGLALVLVPVPLIFLLFPTGRVSSSRWRPLLWLLLAAIAAVVVGLALLPGKIATGFTDLDTVVANPIGLPDSWKPVIGAIIGIAGATIFFGSFLCVLSLVMRFRNAGSEERQQIRWLLYVGAVAAAIPVLTLIISGIRAMAGVHVSDENDPIGNTAFVLFFISILIGIPAACGIAILRYRLYALDVVVKKTVVFGALALFITAVYLVVVFVIGSVVTDQASSTVSFAAGAAAALAFQPLRAVARRLADRLVYGRRATPYEVLSEFSDRLADTHSTDDVLPRMAALLGTSTGATESRVWLLLGAEFYPVAAWPTDTPTLPSVPIDGEDLPSIGTDAYPVRHQGELLGAITLAMPANDPMSPAKEKLATDLAAQAGLVLRNVRLIEELRASRRRIVTAQDERAKTLERNIHDGAQQQLVALAVKQRLAATVVRRNPDRAAEMLEELQTETAAALENLRDLARGIYPPLLADKGLAAALESQARKAAVPTTVESDGIGRYPQEVESAVYFCTLEALNNVAKYAEASRAEISLAQDDGGLTFTVADDGVGFDADMKAYGTGLQGMRDRLDAIGGTLEIRSQPGRGTTVTGRVSVGATEQA